MISGKRLKKAAEARRDLEEPLENWFKRAKRAQWLSIVDVRADFPPADAVGRCTVFNITGNRYRLIARIQFERRKVYIKEVLTHAEYSKGEWKKWL